MICCEIFPKRSATTDQLLELGCRLRIFFSAGTPFPGAAFGDYESDAVDDLVAGELPSPVAIRSRMVGRIWNEDIFGKAIAISEVRKARSVAFNIEYTHADGFERTRGRLRQIIPHDLVTDVVISGHSWSE